MIRVPRDGQGWTRIVCIEDPDCMKQLDALTQFATLRLDTEAANDAARPAGLAAAIEPAPQPAGWDPFEVWRTRVRDARRDAEGPTGT